MLANRLIRLACFSALLCGVTLTAHAQNPEEGDTSASASFGASADTNTGVSTTSSTSSTYPSSANLSTVNDNDDVGGNGDSDHDKVVGTFGVGFFGVEQLPLYRQICTGGGVCQSNAGDNISAPMIGGRYWLSDLLGIEAALGLGIASTSAETQVGNTTVSGDVSGFGLGLHGGVPLALVDEGHFVFEVVPQANLGFTSGSATTAAGDVDSSGFLFELGATVGAEIHFGFIDLPQLSLQANVGLMLSYQSVSQTGTGATPAEYKDSGFNLSTMSGQDPWEIMVGNISAIYYF